MQNAQIHSYAFVFILHRHIHSHTKTLIYTQIHLYLNMVTLILVLLCQRRRRACLSINCFRASRLLDNVLHMATVDDFRADTCMRDGRMNGHGSSCSKLLNLSELILWKFHHTRKLHFIRKRIPSNSGKQTRAIELFRQEVHKSLFGFFFLQIRILGPLEFIQKLAHLVRIVCLCPQRFDSQPASRAFIQHHAPLRGALGGRGARNSRRE